MTTVHINSTEQISIEGDRPVLVLRRYHVFPDDDIVLEFGNATALMHVQECLDVLIDNELARQRQRIAATYASMVEEKLRMENLIGGVTA